MRTQFNYFAPATLSAAHELLDEHGESAEILAGGTDLLVDIRNDEKQPDAVIDIKNIEELNGVKFDSDDGLIINAAATCTEVSGHSTVRERYPFIVEATAELASHQVRNRATVVGNICNASPCADAARPLLCLDASLEISSIGGNRTLPLKDFITGVKKNDLAPNELVERVRVPAEMADARGGNRKLKRIKGHDLSLASVTMIKTDAETRVSICACSPIPVVLSDFDASADADELCRAAEEAISPIDNVRSTAEYRNFMIKQYIRELNQELGVSI